MPCSPYNGGGSCPWCWWCAFEQSPTPGVGARAGAHRAVSETGHEDEGCVGALWRAFWHQPPAGPSAGLDGGFADQALVSVVAWAWLKLLCSRG